MTVEPALPHGALDSARRLSEPVGGDERHRGRAGEGPTLVEYADFHCPGCRAFHARWTGLPDELTGRVRFVHRHFPQVTSHPRAMQSALAAEAAGEQGAFWPMYDLLLTSGRDREPGSIYRYAEELGLDVGRFRTSVQQRRSLDRVWRDLRTGRASGVEGTPGLFLDGVGWEAPEEARALEEDVEAWLEASEG